MGPGSYDPSLTSGVDDPTSSALSPNHSLFRKSFNTRASDGNSRGVMAASNYMINGVHSSPYHNPKTSPRASPRSTPASSPRVGSPRRSLDSFYGSPKKQGVPGGGVVTPMLSSPPKRSPPVGPSSFQVAGEKHSKLVGGPGGGFGPGRSSPSPHTPAATTKQTLPPSSAGHQQQEQRSGRGTPTGLPGTAGPAVGGTARGTYLALYAGSPARHGENTKPHSSLN